jgi:hypothetical protein
MRKLFITLLVFGLFGTLLWTQRVAILDWIVEAQKVAALPEAVTYEEVGTQDATGTDGTEGTKGSTDSIGTTDAEDSVEAVAGDRSLPATYNLAVPFTSQAPSGDWGEPYQEACEEASIYMVHRYFEGDLFGAIDPEVADAGIWEVVNFENALFGFYKDTTAAQTAVLIEQMWGYERVEMIEDPTVDDIKVHVAAGRPVIVPAAGRQLGNPFFTSPGPVYHMLVIKGYTEGTFITNDPGTRRGENYSYNVGVLMNAIHDWNDGDVENGKKVAIVIYPNE